MLFMIASTALRRSETAEQGEQRLRKRRVKDRARHVAGTAEQRELALQMRETREVKCSSKSPPRVYTAHSNESLTLHELTLSSYKICSKLVSCPDPTPLRVRRVWAITLQQGSLKNSSAQLIALISSGRVPVYRFMQRYIVNCFMQ